MELWLKIITALTGMIEKNEIVSIARFFDLIQENVVDQNGILCCDGLRSLDHLLALITWLLQCGIQILAANSTHHL